MSSASGLTLHLAGSWQLSDLSRVYRLLEETDFSQCRETGLALDGGRLDVLDTASALALLCRLRAVGVDVEAISLEALNESHRRIIELVRQRLDGISTRSNGGLRGLLASFGLHLEKLALLLQTHLGFLGLTVHALGSALLAPRIFRVRELLAQFGQTCTTAIPVVSLVMFLIGVVVAYLLGLQASKFGANIFVVDGVSLGMVREFSPLLVAVIVAGRSGAAFTAQLGTMKLTEEIDAIRTLGLSAEQVLLVPRVLALVLGLPLLVVVGDLMGMAGAAMVCSMMLDITVSSFINRVQDVLEVRHYLIGLGKAPVFAFFIAVIGCSMGLSVGRDTRSIGINTTSTVVQSIVAVILLDAFFAVLMQELGL